MIQPSICTILVHDSFLDLSGVKTGSEQELQSARSAGPISVSMKTLVLSELAKSNKLLSETHRSLALKNLG